jgi:hypothetical protein
VPLRAALRAVGDAAELLVSPVGMVADEVPSQRAGLAETAHRPWPLPARPWLMGQTWYSLLFAHWAVRPEALRPLIPQPLELDLREGQAWLGVTPFVVGGPSPDFRLAFTSGVSANSVCFERELLDHYRLVFEKKPSPSG